MKKLYLFDFDGTLTYRDTLFLFLKYYHPQKYFLGFLKHIPLFILMKLKLISPEKVKKSFIASVLKGEKEKLILQKSQTFADQFFTQIIRENALDFIQKINRDSVDGYLVTASLDIWTRPFAQKLGLQLIATEADFQAGVCTGAWKTKNNNGKEKVRRIKQEIKDKKYDKIIAFGDTSGDRSMLSLAHEAHYRFFH